MNYLSKKSLLHLALVLVVVLVAGLVMGGCYENYGLTIKDYDAYLTAYTQKANFQNYKYFIMPDTIMHIGDPGIVDPISAARKYDKQILSLTASNLQARGYTRLSDSTQIPLGGRDSVLVVLIGQFSSTYSGYYYDYWYGYWGGYYPIYGYPPAYVSTYEFTVGTQVTELLDFGQSTESRAFPVWMGMIQGLTGEPSTTQSRIATGINRTFEQSPYLYAGQ